MLGGYLSLIIYLNCAMPPALVTNSTGKDLQICSWNVHGLGNKLSDTEFCEILRENDINILLESWLNPQSLPRLEGYQTFSKTRPRNKKTYKYTGGICVLVKNQIAKGISFLKNTTSNNLLWMKLDRSFFKTDHNIFLCAAYIPPEDSPQYDNTFPTLENDIPLLAKDGQIMLIGDFNARTGNLKDYILSDSLNHIPLPPNYTPDLPLPRNNMDSKTNQHGKELINLCIGNGLRILNGRIIGDLLGCCTSYQTLGASVIDYAVADPQLLKLISSMRVSPPSYLSDHAPITLTLSCSLSRPTQNVLPIPPPTRYLWKDNSQYKLTDCLTNERLMDKILELGNPHATIDSHLSAITEVYQTLTKASCKPASPKLNERKKRKDKPWMVQSLKSLILECKVLGSNINKFPHDPRIREHFHFVRRTINKEKKRLKREFTLSIINTLDSLPNGQTQEFWNNLSKLREPKQNEDPPNITEFCDYFSTLTKDKQPLHDCHQHIIKENERFSTMEFFNPITDSPISTKEICTALNKLKTKKSSGPDLIPNEVLKASAPVMLNPLTALFNSIMKNGTYPTAWNESHLTLIHKKDNPLDPANYRGISLTSCLSKLFNSIINERLLSILQTKLNKFQHGFTANRRTSDPILILRTLIDKYISPPKGKLYACFIDYEKAFDTVWRPGLFFKLQQLGVGSSCLNLIKSMYANTMSQLKFNQGLSEQFQNDVGVKQGDNLSPTLFNIYINDLPKIFDLTTSAPSLVDSAVPCLLFADDLMLLSTTPEGLQHSLNKLSEYNKEWRLTLSLKKTNTLMFSKSTRPSPPQFVYNNNPLVSSPKYNYLGIEINQRGKFSDGIASLCHKGLKAIYKIRSLTSNTLLPIPTSLRLFDSLVKPIITYNADIWLMDLDLTRSQGIARAQKGNKTYDIYHSIESSPFERLQSRFIKASLGIPKTASSNAAKLEVGKLPIEGHIKLQSLKNWQRISSLEDSLVKEAQSCALLLHKKNKQSWATYVLNIMSSIGLQPDPNLPEAFDLPLPINNLKNLLESYYSDIGLSSLNSNVGRKQGEGNKLRTYATFKNAFTLEPYLTLVKNPNTRRAITKLRTSTHALEIERGRYNKTPPHLRFCQFCPGKIGDEAHFVMHCKRMAETRAPLTQACKSNIQGYSDMKTESQFLYIMKANTKEIATALGTFCIAGFEISKSGPPGPPAPPPGIRTIPPTQDT